MDRDYFSIFAIRYIYIIFDSDHKNTFTLMQESSFGEKLDLDD